MQSKVRINKLEYIFLFQGKNSFHSTVMEIIFNEKKRNRNNLFRYFWLQLGISKTSEFNTNYNYDLNGNITTLQRHNTKGLLNDFEYEYDGNKLVNLTRKASKRLFINRGDLDNNGIIEPADGLQIGKYINQETPEFISKPFITDKLYEVLINKNINPTLFYVDSDLDGKITIGDTNAIVNNYYNDISIYEPQENPKFEYEYDNNGNMIYDEFKNINIKYNYLNLPKEVNFADKGKINYVYDANGTLLKRKMFDLENKLIKKIDYIDNFQFENDTLLRIATEEGYLNKELNYNYNITDHLGNIRAVLDNNNKITQENAYYPFGMKINSLSFNSQSSDKQNKYLYNGKEMQDDFGYNVYDYEWRDYDPALGRWNSIDPLCEWDFAKTPYHYTYNNPINKIDLLGLGVDDVNELEEVVVTADRPKQKEEEKENEEENIITRTWNSFKNWVQPFGFRYRMPGGQGQETYKAKKTEDGGNIEPYFDLPKFLKKIFSDKKANPNNKTDATGKKSLKEREKQLKEEKKDSVKAVIYDYNSNTKLLHIRDTVYEKQKGKLNFKSFWNNYESYSKDWNKNHSNN